MFILLTTLLAAQPGVDTARLGAVTAPTPPIQISLNDGGNYAPGGLVNVRVETNDDGYLIVFRVDGDGHIRVLFPLDPDGDTFVRGGKEYELRGRADRSTFFADDRGGTGMIYAALARQSYVTSGYVTNGHWDYDALRFPDSTRDAENELTTIVSRMTNGSHFDYDALGYRVQEIAATVGTSSIGGYYPGLYDPFYNPRWRCVGCGWGYPGVDIAVGFGYSPFWDPWLYSPWGYSYNWGFGYGYTGRNWWYGGYPVVTNPRPVPTVPPGTRARPRAEPPTNMAPPHSNVPPAGRPTTSAPPPSSGHPTAPPPSAGTRARPRGGDDIEITRVSREPQQAPSTHPVFRQPQVEVTPPTSRPEPQVRPVYREPPQSTPEVRREPPPPPAPPPTRPSSPPPASHSAPPPPPPTSRPRAGGGGGHRP